MTIYQIQMETNGKWIVLDVVQDKQFAHNLVRRLRRKGHFVKVVNVKGEKH